MGKRNFNSLVKENFDSLEKEIWNLQKIYLGNIFVTQVDWASIITNCPLIETLILDSYIIVQGSASLIFQQWENLKEVKLSFGLYLEEIFPALKGKTSKIKWKSCTLRIEL